MQNARPVPPQQPGGASAAPPAPAPGASKGPGASKAAASRRLPLVVGAVAAAALVCGLTVWAVAGDDEPRLNDDTVTLVKFVSGGAYEKLPFARQAEYMKVLEDRDDNDELEAAFEAGRLSEAEYRAGLLEAWLGQQVKRSEKFASLPPGPARDRYVRELLDKKDAKKARKAAKPRPADADPEVKRDKALQDIRIAAWPADARGRWEQYRRAYDAQKEAREAAAAAPKGEAAGS